MIVVDIPVAANGVHHKIVRVSHGPVRVLARRIQLPVVFFADATPSCSTFGSHQRVVALAVAGACVCLRHARETHACMINSPGLCNE